MLEPDHPSLYGQHDSGLVHQQGRGFEVKLSLCSPLETSPLVQPKANCVTSQTYSRSPECYCGQTVQTQRGDLDGVVSPTGSLQPSLSTMARTGSGLVCNQILSQASQVCVPSSGQVSLGSRCAESPVDRSGCVCLSSDSPSGTGGHQTVGPRLSPAHSYCPRACHGFGTWSACQLKFPSHCPRWRTY